MQRRDFLRSTAALACSATTSRLLADKPSNRQVMTVTGLIDAEKLGTTLPHEHVMVDFIGADMVNQNRYERDEVFQVALPHLKRARQSGCQTLVECTPA